MNQNKFIEIEKLINEDKIKEAQSELSKMGPSFFNNPEYIYLRGKVFYIKKQSKHILKPRFKIPFLTLANPFLKSR